MKGNLAAGARVRGILVGAAIVALAASAASAESIWARRDRTSAFLFTDNVAAQVGDSLTVLIADESTVKNKDDRKLEKTTDASGSVKLKTALVDFTIPSGNLQQESSRTLEGSSDRKSSRRFTDSVTVTVIDELPNGNLVVAGRSARSIDDEVVVTILTGVVRPVDISGANTVSSTRVAHLSIYYETSGPDTFYAKDGWLNAILNYLWPF